MSMLKAKEFDRIGIHKKVVEYEQKIKNLEYENEVLEGEGKRAKELEEELNFFKSNQEEHFTQFETKFEELSQELNNLKYENSMLKKNEGSLKAKVAQLAKDKDELLVDLQNTENIDINANNSRLTEIEHKLKSLMDKGAKNSTEEVLRNSLSDQALKNEKNHMIYELQEKIQKFKDDYIRKRQSKDYFINE